MSYADSTLRSMTKAELIRQVKVAEHNAQVLREQLDQQYKNVKDWQPVRHAHWVVTVVNGREHFRCSDCGTPDVPPSAKHGFYCWNCGAKMDGDKR